MAQRPVFPERNLAEQMAESLNDRAERIGTWETAYQAWLTQVANFLELPMRVTMPALEGAEPFAPQTLWLVDVDSEGQPQYHVDQNVAAAISTQAKNLNLGFLELDGNNEIVAIWESGTTMPTHQEFQLPEGGSRVTVMDGGATSDHATHVGGTIAAAGVDPAARGMAPLLRLETWDSTSSQSEATANMASSATDLSNPSISNHSYGSIAGWHFRTSTATPVNRAWHWGGTITSNQHDLFGRYTKYTQRWDELAYRNQAYLPIRSAGNDRNNNPADGDTVYYRDTNSQWTSDTYDINNDPAGDGLYRAGFDTIPNNAIGKNILTVGAASDAVIEGDLRDPKAATPTGFTGYGPADDGRIKPDVVANGHLLYSSISTDIDHYDRYSGTSMSTPNVTGTAALLQQLARTRLNPSRRLYADELKGLLIHTADDLLNPGPDYSVGWGQVNGASAAHLLRSFGSDNVAFYSQTLPLEDSDEFIEFDFDLEVKGEVDLKVTLCWVDPAGEAQAGDSTTPVLVHDLDLRIFGPDDDVYLPFVLDPENPADPATRGDNVLDNVEQVIAERVGTGTYRIRVSAKEVTSGVAHQNFAVWVSPVMDPIAINTDVIELLSSANSFPQKVFAEGDWAITTSALWLKADKPSGSGRDTVQMQVEPNLSGTEREAKGFLTAVNGRGRIGFRVKQAGWTPATLADALEQTQHPLTNNSATPWIGQSSVHNGNGDAALISGLADSSLSKFELQLEGPAEIRFDYLVDSEVDDYFRFRINGSIFVLESGTGNSWETATYTIGEGMHTLTWEYEKDISGTLGGDYAAVDELIIRRLLPEKKTLDFPALGGTQTLSAQIEEPTASNRSWSVRNTSPWIRIEGTFWRGTGPMEIRLPSNPFLTERQGSFEIGTDELGWQEIRVVQEAQERYLGINDVFPDLPFSFRQDPEDVPWVGLEEFNQEKDPALVAAGLASGERAILRSTVEGPGFLGFSIYGGFSSGTEDDYFGFSINGNYTQVTGSGNRSDTTNSVYRHYLPEGTHELSFEFYYQGGASRDRLAAIRDLRFIPGDVAFPELIPAGGLSDQVEVSLPIGTAWELETRSAKSRLHFATETVSGTGSMSVPAEFLPNPHPDDPENQVELRLPDFGFFNRFSIPFQPEAPTYSRIAEAFDQPGLVFRVTSDDPLDPSNALIQGQDALSLDGVDAVVLGPETPRGGKISTTLTGPAVLSFDLFIPRDLDDEFVFRVPELHVEISQLHPTLVWRNISVEIPAGMTVNPEWVEEKRGYAYLDRLRITRPADLEHGLVLDRVGGLMTVPLPENSAPTSSESWLDAGIGDGMLWVAPDPLPENLKSRFAQLQVGDQMIQIMQLDHRAMEAEYLTEVGASSVDQLYTDSQRHPLGDLDGDGGLNLIEWVFCRNLNVPDLPDIPASGGITLKLRDSPWVRPVFGEATSLGNFEVQHLERVGGTWMKSGNRPILHMQNQQSVSPMVDSVDLLFPANVPDVFFFYQAAEGR